MTVAELKLILNNFPDDAPIYVADDMTVECEVEASEARLCDYDRFHGLPGGRVRIL